MKNKIVLVNYPGRKGGGAMYAYEMTKALISNGCKVAIVISKDIENIREWRKLKSVKTIEIDTYNTGREFIINSFLFWTYRKYHLKKQLRQYEIENIYCPMIQPWTMMINSLFKKAKRIVTLHDPKIHSGENRILAYINKKCVVKAHRIIILSDTFRDFTKQKFNKKDSDIIYIPHGSFGFYKENTNKNKIVEYNSNKVNFLFFGRISKYKGLHVLQQAYEIVSNEISNTTLTIAGSGDFSEFKEKYSQLKNVTVINRWFEDNEVGNLFEGDNIICVLPYIDATQSGVIPIAMEYKLPIIASNTGGLVEQLHNGKIGCLVEANNPEQLAKAMIKIARDREYRENLGENAYKALEEYKWETLSKKLIEVLE